ncbi:MAG: hypothetical protein AAGF47_02655 [Planctomycetota bacterium]
MNRDRVVQLIAGGIMLVMLGGSGVLSTRLTESIGTNRLVYADSNAENDRPEVALGIAMGAFRGLFVNMLWFRANELKEAGMFHEAVELSRAITRLQPRFPRVWVFHAWNLAYNISVTTQTSDERWRWVQSGVRLLRNEALRANPNDVLIHKELAWIFLHKVQGLTDDANQYYKRRVAEEWTSVLGPPPPITETFGTRESAIRTYTDWLGVVADAPATFDEASRRDPNVEELRDRLLGLFGAEDSIDTLRRYAIHEAMHRAGFGDEAFGGILGITNARELTKIRAYTQLKHDPEFENAWSVYIAYLRKRVLLDEYNMDPDRMVRYTETYGPLDWRHPAAHSLYWARTGVERGMGRVETRNQKDFDFINTDRMVTHSIQELFRYGEIYFDYLESVKGNYTYYIAIANPHYIDAYTEILDEVTERAGEHARRSNPYNTYAAGYQNFISDAILLFYRRGNIDEANRYLDHLRNWPGLNWNDWTWKRRLELPLPEFVQEEMVDRYTSPQLYATQVTGAIQGAFISGLLTGNDELFRSQYEWAKQFHAYYVREQLRTTLANPDVARMEVLPRDWRVLVGGLFHGLTAQLPLEQRVDMYLRAPNDVRLYAYILAQRDLRERLDERAEQGQGEPFDALFPAPEGIERFREELEQRRQARDRDINVEAN